MLAQSAVLAGAAGILAAIPSVPPLQALLFTIFAVAGVGSAALCWLRLPAGAAVAGVIGLSLAAVIALPTSMAWLKVWYPTPSWVVLSLIVVAVGSLRLRSLSGNNGAVLTAKDPVPQETHFSLDGTAPPLSPTQSNGGYIGITMLVLALGIWALALPGLHRTTAGQWGLLVSESGVLLLIAVVLTVTGFVVAIATHHHIVASMAVLVGIVVGRVTVPMITDVPIYTWTYKHVGIVDYIVKYHALPPTGVDVYNQWPGFFTAMAWFSSITGSDLIVTAHWFGIFTDVLLAVLVATLAMSFNATVRTALVAAMLAQLVNWVGQDYYSPQSIAIVLCVSILTMLSYSRNLPAATFTSIPIFAVLVPTHQLTPLWVVVVTTALALFKKLRPRWLAAVYLAILLAYLIPRYRVIAKNGGIASFNPFQNTKTIEHGRGSNGCLFSVFIERGLSLSIWLAAAICFVLIWRRMRPPWELGAMAFSPLALILALNYGGEAILRVFLYSIPGSCVLIAPFLSRTLSISPPRPIRGIILGWLALTLAGAAGMQGYYGGWTFLTVTRLQLEQSRNMLAENQPTAAITVLAPPAGWPERASADYVKFALAQRDYDNPLDDLRTSLLKGLPTPEAIDNLEAVPAGGALYIVLPEQVWAYNTYIGLFPTGALENLVEQLSQRPNWVRVIDDKETLAFKYEPQTRRRR